VALADSVVLQNFCGSDAPLAEMGDFPQDAEISSKWIGFPFLISRPSCSSGGSHIFPCRKNQTKDNHSILYLTAIIRFNRLISNAELFLW